MISKKSLTFIFGALILTACETVPSPEPIVNEPVKEVMAEEIAEQPAVVEPEVDRSLGDVIDLYAPTPGSVDDFAAKIGGDTRIYFGYNEYTLDGQSADALKLQAQWLNSYTNVKAIIEGNADERGTREYNFALAARRADSIKDYLVSQGVNASRLTTVSYGKERPIDGRSDEAGWARNRNGNTKLRIGYIG